MRLIELHELNWFPKTLRDLFTDLISYFTNCFKIYYPVSDLLAPLIKDNNFTIIDLCSGAGMPIITAINSMDKAIRDKIQITLTDINPNIDAFSRLTKESGGKINFIDKPVDAADVPVELRGFRTIFSSFHHFDKTCAQAVLSDAVNKQQGIAIFEFTEKSLLLRLIPYCIILEIWLFLSTPFMRPFRWKRILWTYLIPILPIVIFWDGIVSCLRAYSQKQLYELTKEFSDSGYAWKTGRIKSVWPFRINYLIGYPA